MLNVVKRSVTGDCEASHFDGKGINVPLTQIGTGPQALLLCAECLQKEIDAEHSTHKTVIQARKVDTLINLKQDIFIAGTVAFAEIQAAVMADVTVPEEKKYEAILDATDKRIATMSASIFEKERSLVEDKNTRHALHIAAQEVHNKLSAAAKAKYKQYNVDYVPSKPTKKEKTTKPVVVKAPGYNKTEFNAACEKYNIPVMFKPRVQSMVINRKISAEQAAKEFAEVMGFSS
jgi:hypothetical protein